MSDRPESWGELYERLASLLGYDEPTAVEWVRQAIEARFGPTPSRQARTLAFQKASGVWMHLADEYGAMLAFTLDVRQTVQAAFARFFDGVIVAGPEWRLSPAELDRPTYNEWVTAALDRL